MRKLEQYLLRSIFRNRVRQGYDHQRNIAELYAMIREAAEAEFTEDNVPTLNSLLSELFEQSLRPENTQNSTT
jgi:hypothetical protein